MKKVIVIIVALMPLLLSGCWDSIEPEETSFVSTLGISITDNNQIELIFHDQMLTPQSGTGKGKSNSTTYQFHKSVGSTIYDAIQQNQIENPQNIYLAHTKAIIVSEEFMRVQGARPLVDFLERNSQIRQNTLILISKKGEFEKVFKPDEILSMDTGRVINSIVDNERSNSVLLLDSKVKNFLELTWEKYCTPYALGVWSSNMIVEGEDQGIGYNNTDKNAYEINVGDIAIFKNDKMVGWLTGGESSGLLWVNGKIAGGNITVDFEGKKISLKIAQTKSDIKPLVENGKMRINVNIKADVSVGESSADADFSDKNVIDAVEESLNEQIKNQIEEAITVSKNYDSDIFRFGNCFYETYPNYWKKNVENWDAYYPNLEVDIAVKSNIEYLGLVRRPTKPVE